MIITYQDGKLKIRMGYNPDKIDLIKQAPDGRRWNKRNREWELPGTADNIEFLMREFRIDSPELAAKLAQLKSPLQSIPDVQMDWRCKPFKHQIDGLRICLANDAKALFYEQGLGKSLVAIKEIEYRITAGHIKRTLIVAPKTVLTAWQIEFRKYSDIKPTVIGGAKRLQLLGQAVVALINYDLLLPMKDQLTGFDMIVFDESQMIKNHTAKRSRIAYTLAKQIKYRLLLTGTPIGNSAADIFSQFKVLDESIFGTNFYCFRNKYFRDMGHGFPDWRVVPVLLPEIKAKMALRSLRLKKEDALDLPEKLYTIQTVDASPEQRRVYRDIEKQLYTEIEGQEIAFHFLLTKNIKINQICSGFLKYENETIEIEHEKLKALKQIVDDYDGKIVIWTIFLHDIEKIMETFAGQIVKIDGSMIRNDQRAEAIDAFQTGDKKIIVLQEQAGSLGITLTAGHLCIFYSRSYSLLNRLQAEDRLHRIGQRNPVTYIDLILKDSIEELIIETVEEKRMLAGFLQGDFEDIIIEKFKKKFSLDNKYSVK